MAKLITNSSFDASPLPVICALGWSTVRVIIDLESASIVYKSLNGDALSYMSDMFTKVNVSKTRSLKNSDYDLRVPFFKNDHRTEILLLPGWETLEWFF